MVLILLPGLQAAEPDSESSRTIFSGCEIDYPPFCLVDEEGRADGFSVELMQEALNAMGHEVTFRTGPWSQVRGWLEEGEIEALPLVGRTPEREPVFDFTFPYLTMHGALVVREGTDDVDDLNDLRGGRVAVMEGDNAEEFLRREERDFEIVATPTFLDALRAVSQGRCDAVLIQRLVALRLLDKADIDNLRVVQKPVRDFDQDFCFAVQEGDSATLALLNEGLSLVMANGTHRQLYNKWFGHLQLPSDRPIVVGGDHNYPPYEFVDEKGRPSGFNVDIIRAVAREAGLDVQIRLNSWDKVIDSLQKGEVDAIQGMLYSVERDKKFDFSEAYIVNHCVGVTQKENGKAPTTIAELEGQRIAVQKDDIMHDLLREHEIEAEIVAYGSQEEALRELANGRHDCALVSRQSALYWIEKRDWENLEIGREPLLSPEYCIAVPHGSPHLLAAFDDGLRAIKQSGEYRRIHKKWMGVYEQGMPAGKVLKYILWAALPLLAIALIVLIYNRVLQKQVARRTAELRESLEFQRALISCSPAAIYVVDTKGRVITWNESAERIFGWKSTEIIGKPLPIVPEEKRGEFDVLRKQVENGGLLIDKELIRQRKDGTRFTMSLSTAPIRNKENRTIGILAIAHDITKRKRAEELLEESEKRYRTYVNTARNGIFIADSEGHYLEVNPGACEMTGYSREELLDMHISDLLPEDLQAEAQRSYNKIASDNSLTTLLPFIRKDGSQGWWHVEAVKLSEDRIMGITTDMTEHERNKRRIEHLNRVLSAIRNVNQLITQEHDQNRLLRRSCEILVETRGYHSAWTVVFDEEKRVVTTAEAGIGSDFENVRTSLENGEWPLCCQRALESEEGLAIIYNTNKNCVTCNLDYSYRNTAALAGALRHDGRDYGVMVVALSEGKAEDGDEQSLFKELAGDISYALYSLEQEQERAKAEESLRQSQKMESVGRLAGGVAHDFNNLLMTIINYADMCRDEIGPEHPIRPWLDEINTAGERSADLTRQLLAFARKQNIEPEVLDLNETIGTMLKMLSRLIGEDIELVWNPSPDLRPTKMDPGQIDQLLANLCVNARDAIGGVGQVEIETDNAEFDEDYCIEHPEAKPGSYVMLAVSDNGCGMDPETLKNLFEPFYTTKPTGKGTGLGLSTVYGIVKQNGGFINVYSEHGEGSTFRIYLPSVDGEPEKEEATEIEEEPAGGSETILVVEDEQAVRDLAKLFLERTGYTVIATGNPDEAVEMARIHQGKIDLVVTDVVMPGMNGKELVEAISSNCPQARILFMSGYTANVVAHRGIIEENMNFIQKPFSRHDFVSKVQEVLEQDSAAF